MSFCADFQQTSPDSLAKFYGIVVETMHPCVIEEYFPRGSLADLLENPWLDLNCQTKISLALDIANGLHYLHKNCGISHGRLRSTNCMVGSRETEFLWILCLSFFFGEGADSYMRSCVCLSISPVVGPSIPPSFGPSHICSILEKWDF